jgi:small subunit ribosomal protein S8
MMNDLINNAVANIKNHSRIGKEEVLVAPTSKLLIDVLKIFQKGGYIGEFEVLEDKKGGQVKVKLIKRINDCGIIKPRFPVGFEDYGKWEKRYLPARDFGILVVTTPKGVMTHKEAKELKTGGRLIAYVY